MRRSLTTHRLGFCRRAASQSRQSPLEGFLDEQCVGCCQSILLGHVAMRPESGVIARGKSSEFGNKPVAQDG